MTYFNQRFQTPLNVLVVDDSAIIRRVMSTTLARHSDMKLVGAVENGQLALDMVKSDPSIDVVLMDIEMPVMDGLTALPLMLAARPKLKIMVISTLSKPNAAVTMEALRLGALDYLPKPSAKETSDIIGFEKELMNKIRSFFADKRPFAMASNDVASAAKSMLSAIATASPRELPSAKPAETKSTLAAYPDFQIQALAIGSSTGGPQALQAVFSAIKGELTKWPIFITQHMPPNFTAILADQISQAVGRPCQEAVHEGIIQPGGIYVAPGNYHMEVGMVQGQMVTLLNQNPQVNYCRPASGRHVAIAH